MSAARAVCAATSGELPFLRRQCLTASRSLGTLATNRPDSATVGRPAAALRDGGDRTSVAAAALFAASAAAVLIPLATAADDLQFSRLRPVAASTAATHAKCPATAANFDISAPGAECSSADGIADDPYEPGQAVGVGIKAEMWKTKHPNLTVLETGEDTPVLGLMSMVRNMETEGAAFFYTANRLMRQLLDYAEMGFPNDDEAVFATPARVMMQGILPEDDLNVCAISMYLEHEPRGAFDYELDSAFPSFERGYLRVRGLTRGSSRELPRNMQGKQVLLLAPVVGYAQPVLAALERLEQAGVEDEDVTLVSVVISKDALETLTDEAEDMKVVCAAMDGETRGSDHQVIPGVGDFSRRYFEAKAIVEAEDAAKAKERSAESSASRKRRWWLW